MSKRQRQQRVTAARHDREARRHRQVLTATWFGSTATAIGAVVALLVWAPWTSDDSASKPQVDSGGDKTVLATSRQWPLMLGCDGSTPIAMPAGTGGITDYHSATDIRTTLVNAGGGSWERGFLYLDMSVAGPESVEITNIKPHLDRIELPGPAWVFEYASGGCGPGPTDRVFAFNLDAPSFHDEGVPNLGTSGIAPSDAPTAPVGPGFTISGLDHARVEVDAYSCKGNYQWSLEVHYLVSGDPTPRVAKFGPFLSFGVGADTKIYSGVQNATGGVTVKSTTTVTGRAPRCPTLHLG